MRPSPRLLSSAFVLLTLVLTTRSYAAMPAPPIDTTDTPTIQLDPHDPTFSAWKRLRDFSKDPRREPGPIDLNRWPGKFDWGGIPTFFGLPVAITFEDLKAGHVDVAIFGAPLDFSSGQRGAAFAPQAIRTSEKYLPSGQVVVSPEVSVQVDPFQTLRCVDFGDGPVDIYSTERTVPAMRKFVRDVIATGAMPVIVGGDHSLMWPDASALQDVYGAGNVGVIHFDAHFDGGQYGFGHLIDHGMPVRRLIDTEHFPGKNFVQVGLRGFYPDSETIEWMRGNGMHSHFMAEIDSKGWNTVVDEALREALDGPRYLMVSLDIDVLDPAYAPGTGTPEPGGLTTRELLPVLRRVCAEANVVAIELVEVNPLVDPGYTTALNANRCLREMLTGVAMRRKGITQRNYHDPRMTGQIPFPLPARRSGASH